MKGRCCLSVTTFILFVRLQPRYFGFRTERSLYFRAITTIIWISPREMRRCWLEAWILIIWIWKLLLWVARTGKNERGGNPRNGEPNITVCRGGKVGCATSKNGA